MKHTGCLHFITLMNLLHQKSVSPFRHMELGLFPLLGEHLGHFQEADGIDDRAQIGDEHDKVSQLTDTDVQSQRNDADQIPHQQPAMGGLVLGMQLAHLFREPAVAGSEDQRLCDV